MNKFLQITKISLVVSMLGILPISTFAQTPQEQVAANVGLFPQKIVGIEDTQSQSVTRSYRDGVAIQYALAGNAIREAQIDENVLVHEINNVVLYNSKFFKLRPKMYGMLMVHLTIYPNYGKTFQWDPKIAKTPDEILKLRELNHTIQQNSKCNAAGYCSSTVYDDFQYASPDLPSQPLDKDAYAAYQRKRGEEQRPYPLYAYNKSYNKPIPIVLILGVNGYYATPEQVKSAFKK